MSLKKLVILHSNDMHGDFLAKEVDDELLGGVSMLSGYLGKVRKEEKNVLYAVSGDMLRGSVIDSEYKGLSTIEIMNLLSPDVVTIGNHEVDYGVAHLLFLEKCAKFPIINANMYLTNSHVRLFSPHKIIKIDGVKVLFIGVLTEDVLAQTRQEQLIGNMVDVKEILPEIERVCNSYRTEDIDLTVLLTHIGFEADKDLAAKLDPSLGIDMIIGGHSHTLMEKPEVVAGIPVVQAAMGTSQVGRFDILVDTKKNQIKSYDWQLIPIREENCPRDLPLEQLIQKYKASTDFKYERVVTRLADVYTHPARNQETQLGRIFSDVFRDSLGIDIMFLGSGSIRSKELGPILLYKDIAQTFVFDEAIYRVTVTGKQLAVMIKYVLREEAYSHHTEFYQFSSGLKIIYQKSSQKLVALEYDGKPVKDEQLFHVGLHAYHYNNMQEFLRVSREEAEENGASRKLATSSIDVLDEWLSKKELIVDRGDERLIILE